MKSQETRRYDDEAFYFDRGELVIDPEVLPDHYPEVTTLKGKNTVAYFIDGDYILGNAKEGFWKHKFYPGTSIVRVVTGDGVSASRWIDDEKLTYEFESEPRDSYEVEPDDLLVLKASITSTYSNSEDNVEVVPASESLPGSEGNSWELEGVITSEGKLISWGGNYQSWLVEMSLARGLIQNSVDYHMVNQELQPTPSLVGSVNVASGVKRYLGYFRDTFGQDFVPKQDLRELFDSDPTKFELTLEQFDRYRAKQL